VNDVHFFFFFILPEALVDRQFFFEGLSSKIIGDGRFNYKLPFATTTRSSMEQIAEYTFTHSVIDIRYQKIATKRNTNKVELLYQVEKKKEQLNECILPRKLSEQHNKCIQQRKIAEQKIESIQLRKITEQQNAIS